jgi:hypothetical protein
VTGVIEPVYLRKRTQALALAEALKALGFTAELLAGREYRRFPTVTVGDGPARQARAVGLVYAAPDDGGEWWFWLADRCAPLDVIPVARLSEVSLGADGIDRALTRARAAFPQAG